MPKEKAMTYAERRLKAFEGSKYPPPPEGTAERAELLANVAADMWHNGEAPDIVTAIEYLSTKEQPRDQ